MNDLISKVNSTKNYKVFRVLNNKYSIVVSENDIKKIIWLLFRTQVTYLNINILKHGFWRNIYESWCKYVIEESTRAYDLSNHIKVQKKGEVITIRVILKVSMEYLVL